MSKPSRPSTKRASAPRKTAKKKAKKTVKKTAKKKAKAKRVVRKPAKAARAPAPAKRAKKAVPARRPRPAPVPQPETPVTGPSAGAPQPAPATPPGKSRIQVRMYLQGLGDFFLVSILRNGAPPFRILFDCGVIVGTPNAKGVMQDLVTKMKHDIGNKLDILIVTHRHADHVSGFLQAEDLFKTNFQIGEVWMSWVEDPKDALGKQLLATHAKAETALRAAAGALQGMGAAAGDEIASLMEFRGEPLGAAAGGSTTLQAVNIAKALGPLTFCRPADPPRPLGDTGARAFVFGPPPDLAALGKMDPSKANPETYGITAMRALLGDIGPALGALGVGDGNDADLWASMPFGPNWVIPLDPNAPTMPEFFKGTYFDSGYAWQRIDGDWLEGASALALAFDQAVNNTSLVIAIELEPGGDVLLFAADAQVGNWLSWHNLSWKLDAQTTVTSTDLLNRAIFYKVGHHASHNATLAGLGLELMKKLQYAMVSVNEEMAHKKRWKQMPFPPLLKSLDDHTDTRTVRADKDIPAKAQPQVAAGPANTLAGRDPVMPKFDYYELTL